MTTNHPWQNGDTFGSGEPDSGTWAADCCGRYCLNCDYGASRSRHTKQEYRDTCVVFEREDLVRVCDVELYVNADIMVGPSTNNIVLAFELATDRYREGPMVNWPHWYHPWESALSSCARRDILAFLDEINAGFSVEEFAESFRHAMVPIFDFAMTKLPMCDNIALWDVLEKEWKPMEGSKGK